MEMQLVKFTNDMTIVDASGAPLGVSGNKLQVNDADANATLTSIDGKDFATETTLAALELNIDNSVDNLTNAIETIDYEHHEIHGGSHFYLCGFETIADTVEIDFAVTTPNTTKWSHMTFDIEGTTQTEFYIYEASAVTGGTAATPLNNNRNSTTTSVLTIVKNPTVNTEGNLIFSQSKGKAGATPSKASSGGVVTRNREIILKQNTTYIFRITSADDDNIISYCGEWYEHTNK